MHCNRLRLTFDKPLLLRWVMLMSLCATGTRLEGSKGSVYAVRNKAEPLKYWTHEQMQAVSVLEAYRTYGRTDLPEDLLQLEREYNEFKAHDKRIRDDVDLWEQSVRRLTKAGTEQVWEP